MGNCTIYELEETLIANYCCIIFNSIQLCSNELTRKILQHSSKQKLDKDILEEVAIIIEEYSEYHLVSSQVSTSDKIKAIKYQLLQSRKTNLKEELFKWLRFDRDN
ncbi:hypothetical protein BpHYR1_024236 [Brachionus plicatilis]|uniref:Uncharacterized protein n=1 Tax=Brachionus plicatilis TaxID=10195 RepID=A0A3M7R8M4_BRAPC|nr:hypothetical protein BpHYR1_024236 [Brachionus plicatilis]